MRGAGANPVPSAETVRNMMAAAAAAATAAAGDAAAAAAAAAVERPRARSYDHVQPGANRRQSMSQLAAVMGDGSGAGRSQPLPSPLHGARWMRIRAVAGEIATKWKHPHGSTQYETETLHLVRAILYLNKSLITQSFVSHVSQVSQGTLSHYVRGLFRGNQGNVEERLMLFVRRFAEGDLDPLLEEARASSRPLSRPSQHALAQVAGSSGVGNNINNSSAIPAYQAPTAVLSTPVAPPPPPQLQPPPWAHQSPTPKQRTPTPSQGPLESPAPAPSNGVPAILFSTLSGQRSRIPATPQHQVMPTTAPPLSPSHSSPVAVSVAGATVPPNAPGVEAPVPTPPMAATTDRALRAMQRQQLQGMEQVQQHQSLQQQHPPPAASKRPRSSVPLVEQFEELTPRLAAERAFHAFMACKWGGDSGGFEPLLLPLEIFVEREGRVLHMFTQWDVNERSLAPETVAERIRRARGFPAMFTEPIAALIRKRLFESGVICAPPPKSGENRHLIKIVAELEEGNSTHVLKDEFEWDLGAGAFNSAELFAQHLCSDAGISQVHAPTVARAIRTEVSRANAIAYGDAETRNLALEGLNPDHHMRHPLPTISSAVVSLSPEEKRLQDREENEIMIEKLFVAPLVSRAFSESRNRLASYARAVADERAHAQARRLREKAAAEDAERQSAIDESLKEVQKQADRIREESGVDLRPYFDLRLGRGERPSVWIEGVFDRKRRRVTALPMTRYRPSSEIPIRSRSRKRRASASSGPRTHSVQVKEAASKDQRQQSANGAASERRETSTTNLESVVSPPSKRPRLGRRQDLTAAPEQMDSDGLVLRLRVRGTAPLSVTSARRGERSRGRR